jgi:lysophospholipase L1-like esterase
METINLFMATSRTYRRIAAMVCLCLGAAAAAGPASAIAAPGIVLGDSIGVGVSMASGLPRLARNSVTIRSASAVAQVKQTPRNTIAFLSLGTNDAVGSIAGVTDAIDRIVETAQRANVNLVWIGPVCVRKPWNTNVVKLDELLHQRLAGRVRYVSAADQALCDGSLRAGDGVHFNMRGYQLLWNKARAAAGADVETAPPSAELSPAAKQPGTGAGKIAQRSPLPVEPPNTGGHAASGGSNAAAAPLSREPNR